MNKLSHNINIFEDDDIIKFLGKEPESKLIQNLRNNYIIQEQMQLNKSSCVSQNFPTQKLDILRLTLTKTKSDNVGKELTPDVLQRGKKSTRNILSINFFSSKINGQSPKK